MAPKLRFTGTVQELKQLVEASGLKGRWQPDSEGARFVTDGGGILLWYGPIIRTIMIQGKEPSRSVLREKLGRNFGDKESVLTPGPSWFQWVSG